MCFSVHSTAPLPQDNGVSSEFSPAFSRCGWRLCARRGKREGWGCGLLTPTRQFAFPETLPFQSSNSIGRLSHFAKSHKSFMQELPLVSQQWSSRLPLPLPPNVSKTKKSDLVLQHQQVKDSYRYSLVNSLIAQQTGLHSSALVTCLWKSVSCLCVTDKAPPAVSFGRPFSVDSSQRQNVGRSKAMISQSTSATSGRV